MFYTSHTRRNRIVLIFTLAICTFAIAENSRSLGQNAYLAPAGITEKALDTANMDLNSTDLAQDPDSE